MHVQGATTGGGGIGGGGGLTSHHQSGQTGGGIGGMLLRFDLTDCKNCRWNEFANGLWSMHPALFWSLSALRMLLRFVARTAQAQLKHIYVSRDQSFLYICAGSHNPQEHFEKKTHNTHDHDVRDLKIFPRWKPFRMHSVVAELSTHVPTVVILPPTVRPVLLPFLLSLTVSFRLQENESYETSTKRL